jgi:hypothetical protein
MRRSLLTATGVTVLALVVPGAALAHHGHGRHHHHKARVHAHHAKFRLIHIGPTADTPPLAPVTTSTPPTPENAGTVASYINGVLTLTLKDGSTVSGKVTNETRIRCVKATPSTTMTTPSPGTGDQSPGEDNGWGDDQNRGDMNQHGDHGSGDQRHGEDGDDDDDDGAPGASEPEPPCDSSALVTGAVVRAAELRIGPGGSEFESVWLVR